MVKQKEQCDALAQDWYKRAQLALEKGNEELAKEALSRRQAQTEEANNLQVQIRRSSIVQLYGIVQAVQS